MFGTLTSLVQSATVGPPPKDVPPQTDIVLPDYRPQLVDSNRNTAIDRFDIPGESLVAFLQTLYRPPQLDDSYFQALGVHVHHNVSPEDLVLDQTLLPSITGWDDMTPECAQDANKDFQRTLCNGNKSPDARIYTDRRKELSAHNQAAFRTLRRIKPEPGKQAVRLGGSYEFFKQMDLMAAYWDDTSLPARKHTEETTSESSHADGDHQSPPKATHIPHPIDGSLDQAAHALVAATTEPARPPQHEGKDMVSSSSAGPVQVVFRTGSGSQMPGSHRHDMVSAFIKMVAYDFGCNISPARVEPRLYLKMPKTSEADSSEDALGTQTVTTSDDQKAKHHGSLGKEPKCSHIPTGSVFLFRMPTTREAARAGIVEGPVAALSVRNTTSFTPTTHASWSSSSSQDLQTTPMTTARDEGSLDARLDFGRELVAALVTAQLRNREGKTEQRIGEGKWWASEKRWGGGQGGPIGRELEHNDASTSSKDRNRNGKGSPDAKMTHLPSPSSSSASSSPSSPSPPPPTASIAQPSSTRSPLPRGGNGSSSSSNKRARKTHSLYDNYRMVRKPTSNWDKKTRYEAIGKQPGADYDDIFLFSSLFHHLSVVRVRVPHALLSVFDGDIASAVSAEGTGTRPWGKLEVWRSKWFDLFIIDDRLEAMRLLWGVMMWLMRKVDDDGQQKVQGDGDVVMRGS